MSIISCTSPSASCVIFPASRETSVARSCLRCRSFSPMRRTNSPRFGAGTSRHVLNASLAMRMTVPTSSFVAHVTVARVAPSMGERAGTCLPFVAMTRLPAAAPGTPGGMPSDRRTLSLMCRSLKEGYLFYAYAAARGHALGQVLRIALIRFTESVREEIFQLHLLLSHEALVRQFTLSVQVDHGAQTRGRGDLNGAGTLSHELAVINLTRVGELHEPPVLPAHDGAEDQHDVLRRHRHRVLQDVLEDVAPRVEAQLVHEKRDQVAVAAVADRLVVQRANFAGERVAQRADA